MPVVGIIIAAILAVGFVRVRVSLRHDPEQTRLTLRVGPLRFRILPAKARKAKKPPKKERAAPMLKNLVKEASSLGMREIAGLVAGLVKKAARGVRVDRLTFDYTLGGRDDPCQAAIAYGRWMAAAGAVLPMLDKHLRIKRFSVNIAPDFTREESEMRARLDASLSIGRGIGLFIYILGKGAKLTAQNRNPGHPGTENKRRKAA